MNVFIKYLLLVVMVCVSEAQASLPVYSGNDTVIALKPGTNRDIIIQTTGALLASRIWVSGANGIVVSKLRDQNLTNPNQLKIRLVVTDNASAGEAEIHMRLPLGVHKRKIWVHALSRANITVPPSTMAGNLARVTLGDIQRRYTEAYAGRRGLQIKGSPGRHYIDVPASGNRRQTVAVKIVENTRKGRTGHRHNFLQQRTISVPFSQNYSAGGQNTANRSNSSTSRNSSRTNQNNGNNQNNSNNRNNSNAAPAVQQLADLIPLKLVDYWQLGQTETKYDSRGGVYRYRTVNTAFCPENRMKRYTSQSKEGSGIGGASGPYYKRSFQLPTTIGIEIKNQGQANAGRFTVQLKQGNRVVSSTTINALAANRNTVIRVPRPNSYPLRKCVVNGGGLSVTSCYACLGSSSSAVDGVLSVHVDSANTIAERNENNNSATFRF